MADLTQDRLYNLFTQIEAEFHALRVQNALLQKRVDELESMLEDAGKVHDKPEGAAVQASSFSQSLTVPVPKATAGMSARNTFGSTNLFRRWSGKLLSGTPSHMLQVLRNFALLIIAASKMAKKLEAAKALNSKIMSRFRNESMPLQMQFEKSFRAHHDGIWEIACAPFDTTLFGTASADQTAKIWYTDSSAPFAIYQGHTGSVNSIAFHSSEPLACTASGDMSVHVWRVPQRSSPPPASSAKRTGTREDHESSDDHKVREEVVM